MSNRTPMFQAGYNAAVHGRMRIPAHCPVFQDFLSQIGNGSCIQEVREWIRGFETRIDEVCELLLENERTGQS
ncbi:hypothetical protein [Photorhabdus stackebrandtii]|uniref:Uncharacterized protein n=1 Tax=Photorhabdus stackebrandtii TaxID=1123042 RepID=A0A7X5QQP3_9GAMM|nr:hypothetical protein [Photorhabdus stackebrandtii]NHB98562.1 hypothetical protein [Photorhabdus stackebrandtii]